MQDVIQEVKSEDGVVLSHLFCLVIDMKPRRLDVGRVAYIAVFVQELDGNALTNRLIVQV